jgi:hypothetical protein
MKLKFNKKLDHSILFIKLIVFLMINVDKYLVIINILLTLANFSFPIFVTKLKHYNKRLTLKQIEV